MAGKCATVPGCSDQILYIMVVYICTQLTVQSAGWNVIGFLTARPRVRHDNSIIVPKHIIMKPL